MLELRQHITDPIDCISTHQSISAVLQWNYCQLLCRTHIRVARVIAIGSRILQNPVVPVDDVSAESPLCTARSLAVQPIDNNAHQSMLLRATPTNIAVPTLSPSLSRHSRACSSCEG